MIQQLIVNIAIAWSVYALVALGFSLIYSTTKFFHFAHGAIFTYSSYAAWFLVSFMSCPLVLAITMAILSVTLLGMLIEIVVYRPLRSNNATSLVLLLASLGIYIVLQNALSLTLGDDVKTIRGSQVIEGYSIAGARITIIQVVTLGTTIFLFFAVEAIRLRTRIGRALRAVASDQKLALISGIHSDRIILFTFALGSFLAAVAGILVSFDVDMTPTMGLRILLMSVVAVVIGGVGCVSGVALGALLLALAQQVAAWKLGVQWQDPIAFIILVIFLLFKPQGLFGKRIMKTSV